MKRIEVRLEEDEHAAIKAAAAREKRSINGFLVRHALAAAEEGKEALAGKTMQTIQQMYLGRLLAGLRSTPGWGSLDKEEQGAKEWELTDAFLVALERGQSGNSA